MTKIKLLMPLWGILLLIPFYLVVVPCVCPVFGAALMTEETDPSESITVAEDEDVEDEDDPVIDSLDHADISQSVLQGSSAEDLLNMATEIKLSASSLLDLNKVIVLCEEALKRGLPDGYDEFCKQLKISTQLQRGLALARLFLSQEDIPSSSLPPNWQRHREMILSDLEEAIEEVPEQAAAHLAIGRLYTLGKTEKARAIAALDKAIEFSGDEPIILAESLKYRAALEDDQQAKITYLEKALSLFPDNPTMLSLIAEHWATNKNFDSALLAIDQAIVAEPEEQDYKKLKAAILVELDRKEEALSLFDEAFPPNRSDILSMIERAQFLYTLGQPDDALAIYSRLIDQHKIPGLYYFRAILYLREKDYKAALSDVNQCLRLDSEFDDAINLKSVIYLQQERYDEAIALIESLHRRQPNDEMFIPQIAYAHAKKDDYDKAMEVLHDALAKSPDSVELLRSKGDIALMYGRWDEATDVYKKILSIHPNDSGVLNNYSWMLSTSPDDSVRNGELALKYAMESATLTYNKQPHILSTLAAAYAELGDFENALHWSQRAVALAEKEKNDRIDDLKSEVESYKENKPWREIPEKLREKQISDE